MGEGEKKEGAEETEEVEEKEEGEKTLRGDSASEEKKFWPKSDPESGCDEEEEAEVEGRRRLQ